jgi:hypothetical protein
MILKVLASIVTGIGGHYLNRRWDKAILFLCLFVLYWAAMYAFFIYSVQSMFSSPNGLGQGYNDTIQFISKISLVGIIIIWLVSLIVTILDSKNKVESNITKWTKSGVTVAILTSILSFIFLAFSVASFLSLSNEQYIDMESTSYESNSFGSSSHNFFEYIYFGGSPSDSRKLPSPPSGEGTLKGLISYQDKPAKGVTLAIVLNSKFRAENIVTDANGVFTVSLPLGAWIINSIQTESWENKPQEGGFTLYYGGEEKLSGKSYNRHAYFQKTGYPVNVNQDPKSIHFNATITKDIDLTWPNPEAERITATIGDIISWEKYPGATQYYVGIKKIRRDGDTTHYSQITSKILSGETSLPLSNLKHITTKEKTKTEYAVEVFAFSDDGTIVSEFSDTFQGGTFLLSEGIILIEDELDDTFNLSSIEDPDEVTRKMEEIARNKRRETAVSVLIEDNMLNEAESLLGIIDSQYSQGKKEVLAGYILALQGECEKSNEMFDKALSINSNACIPDSYKAYCD